MSVDKLVTDILGERPTVKDPALRDMINARMKAGGEVKMGKGGAIKSLVKAIAKELPEAKASQKTQIPGTEPTYRKAYDILEREKPGGRTLDYGAGLGHGSRLMGAESFEPFPREGFKPDFIRPEDIPTEEFDRLVNLNVLNVMPREMRDATVENIGRVMRPGGMGIVTTRGRDVLNAAGEAGPESMSKITSIGTYQKGFTPEELREYLKYMLGEGYDISRLNLGPAGAVVRKKGKTEGGEIKKADGGAIGKNVGRGMAGLRRSRQPLDPKEIQAMMLDVPAGLGVPFAEAGAEYLRGNVEDAETSAAIDAALTAVPVAGALAKPAYRAVRGAVQKAAPAVREAARDVLESGMESGLIQGPSYAVKPTGGQWLSGYKGDPRQIDVSNAPAGTSEDVVQAYRDRLEEAERRALEYTEMSGFEPTQTMTDRVRGLRSDVDRIEQENAVRRWVDSNLNNYVRKQMGTPDDPVLKLAEQGILHMPYRETGMLRSLAAQREKAGFPAEGLATTDLGRMWETMSDRNIASIEAGKLTDPNYLKDLERRAKENDPLFNARPGRINDEPPPAVMTPEEARDLQRFKYMNYPPARANAMEENQWLSRVDPETPIYSLSDPFGGRVSGGDLGFDHIVDVLKEDLVTGRIRPEQLSKMSMEQAVRRTHEYDLERAAAMAKALEEETANLSVAKTFDDGFKIVQLDKPGQFAKESDRMGHSVRGYEPPRQSEDWTEASGVEGSQFYGHGGWDAIKSGEAQVFSIRDAKNQPHVTIELGAKEFSPIDWVSSLSPQEKRKVDEMLKDVEVGSHSAISRAIKKMPEYQAAKAQQPKVITQIKGKQNRKPDEDYLPYVQQFIREGNYEIAGDLRNSGLIDLQSGQRPAFVPTDAPRYVTQAELDRMQRTGKFEPDFKEGGAVQKYGKGGVVKKAVSLIEEAFRGDVDAAGRAAAGRKGAEYIKSQPKVKASEALGQLMEKGYKRTSTTQADRTRVGGGNIGGASFSAISAADPVYAGKVWGVGEATTAARLANLTTPETAWTTMLGSATQLKTNPIVFDKLKREFRAAIKEGRLSPELEAKINHNLALTFGEGANIRDPKIWKEADTFEKRAALADIMMGQGIPPKKGGVALGGEKSGKGVIFKPTDILKEETEPGLFHPEHGGDVPTFAVGPRLFSLEKEFMYRPDLHPGFPVLLKGEDLGYSMEPVPTEVFLPDWHKSFREKKPERFQGPWSPEIIARRKSGSYKLKGQEGPGYYDLALGLEGEGLPSQELSDEYIRHLLREGFKEGGAVSAGALPKKRA